MNTNTGQKDKIMWYTEYCGNKPHYAAYLKNSVLFVIAQKWNEMNFWGWFHTCIPNVVHTHWEVLRVVSYLHTKCSTYTMRSIVFWVSLQVMGMTKQWLTLWIIKNNLVPTKHIIFFPQLWLTYKPTRMQFMEQKIMSQSMIKMAGESELMSNYRLRKENQTLLTTIKDKDGLAVS